MQMWTEAPIWKITLNFMFIYKLKFIFNGFDE